MACWPFAKERSISVKLIDLLDYLNDKSLKMEVVFGDGDTQTGLASRLGRAYGEATVRDFDVKGGLFTVRVSE